MGETFSPENLHRQEVVVTSISGSVLIKYVIHPRRQKTDSLGVFFHSRPSHEPRQRLFLVCLICLWIMGRGIWLLWFYVWGPLCSSWSSNYKRSLDVPCVSCSCRSKPVLNSQLPRREWFCSIWITSSSAWQDQSEKTYTVSKSTNSGFSRLQLSPINPPSPPCITIHTHTCM